MAKKIFLVDTENVSAAWLSLLPALGKSDELILMYTDKTPHMSYSNLVKVLPYHDRFQMMKCNMGPNALDFQLSSYMGFLMKTSAKTQFYIVSNDTGYDPLVSFWAERDRCVERLSASKIRDYIRAKEGAPEKMVQKPEPLATEPTPATPAAEEERKPAAQPVIPLLEEPSKDAEAKEQKRREMVVMTCMGYTKKAKTFRVIMDVLNRYSSANDNIFGDLRDATTPQVAASIYGRLKNCLDEFYGITE